MSRRPRLLLLSELERQTLEQVRDHHPTPYMRERAAALLRIATGEVAYQVALTGVLRARDPDTLYTWLRRYEREGVAGLFNHRQGRGFPPQQIEAAQELLHQPPPATTRWSLKAIGGHLPWLNSYTLSGVWRVLNRYGLRYKRGRHYLHSPDPAYRHKRDSALACVAEARRLPGRRITLYLDEMSYYRQPSVARAWSVKGALNQPQARLSYHRNSLRRLVGALDVVTGRVIYEQWPKIGVRRLAAFYQVLRHHYPEAEVIYLIQDNWPIHFYPQVEQAAATARVEMVRLPTYAPWLNPIEKLWRKLRQEVLHLHRLSDDWLTLQQRVSDFFHRFADGSQGLLRYVGLLPN